MFPLDPPENDRKRLIFRCFRGDQKGTLGRNGLKSVTQLLHIEMNFASANLLWFRLLQKKSMSLKCKKKNGVKNIFISGLVYDQDKHCYFGKNSCYNSKFLPEIRLVLCR